MASNSIIILVTGMIIGTAVGWHLKPTQLAAEDGLSRRDFEPKTKRAVRTADAVQKKHHVAKRWIDKAELEGIKKISGEIPPEDMAAVMERMFNASWGGLDEKQLDNLLHLMISWGAQDKDGALAWARTLTSPQQREIALTGISSSVGKQDPMAGFEIYAEIGEVKTAAGGRALEAMMIEVYRLAAEKGADAMVDIVKRSPVNETRTIHGIPMNYPEDFDFVRLMDGLSGISRSNRILDKAIVPPDPMGKWVLRDPDAAFDYAVGHIANGGRVSLDRMVYEMGQKSGSLEAQRWIAEKLTSVPQGQIPDFIRGAGVLSSPGIFRQYLQQMPYETAAEFRIQSIKIHPDISMELLLDIPAVDDRVALVERLRDVKEPGSILGHLKKWNVPQEKIDQVGELIQQPER